MEHFDTILSAVVSVVLAICGVLVNRALQQIDESLQRLWQFANESADHRAELHARVSVIEAMMKVRNDR